MSLQTLLRVRLHFEHDLIVARTRAKQLTVLLKLRPQDQTRFATAVSELARNAFTYAGGGDVEYLLDPGARLLWAHVQDEGPGIAQLGDLLAESAAGPSGRGVGLRGARQLVDAFEICTAPGEGTLVRAAQRVPPSADLAPQALVRLTEDLARAVPLGPVEELQAQNQELLGALAELARREAQLQVLNRELEDTNRGVVALYSELEQKAEQVREAERQLRQLNAGLALRVQEGALRLAELNAEMAAYARSLSRDIQEPLRRVQGFLGLLRRRLANVGDEKVEQYLGIIATESARVGTLVEDLGALALSEGRELRREPVPLTQLVVQVRSDLEPLSRGRKVEWHIAPLPTVQGDALLLRGVLTNVLHNALKFTRERERAVIEVDGELRGGEVVVRIRDNGVGFDPAEAARLFEVFQRLHGETFEGAGVGLANVRRIVARHDGRVWAEGRVGEGAIFYISLPVD